MDARRLRLSIAPLLAIGILSGTATYAQGDPGAVARACIERLRAVSEACAREMIHTARGAALRIDELQANGQPRRARQVAEAALGHIRETAMQCQARIAHITRRCLRRLHEMGAPDVLLAAVREASQRASQRVRGAAHRAAQIVITALEN